MAEMLSFGRARAFQVQEAVSDIYSIITNYKWTTLLGHKVLFNMV